MAIAIPLTLRLEPVPFVLLFGALTGGATYMGSVTAILFGVPGRNSNAATVIDGHALARRGEAKTALACSATASALGSTFGVLALVALIPFLAELTLAFGPAEILMASLWGLSTIAVLVRGSVVKGWTMACLGLLLSFVGYDSRTAEPRFSFGSAYLSDGLSLVPVFLGIFAITAAIDLLARRRTTISGVSDQRALGGSVREGVQSIFIHAGLFVRSSVIGTAVGLVPGIGATVASLVAYGHAARSAARRGGSLGGGDLRGVLAPEAANDAKDGGALVPALAFGIPGGSTTALLLSAFSLHGIRPGQELFDSRLALVFALVWSLFLSNWLTSLVGLAAIGPLSRLTTVPTRWLVPLILTLSSVGAYVFRSRIEDVVLAYVCGGLGFLFLRFGWPRVPLVAGLVLGPVFESNFHLTRRLHELGRVEIWSRPIAMGLLALTILSLAAPLLRRRASLRTDRQE